MTQAESALISQEVADLRRRVDDLQAQVNGLNDLLKPAAPGVNRWWRAQIGAFAHDPVYEEITRLGREWREAQTPAHDPADDSRG